MNFPITEYISQYEFYTQDPSTKPVVGHWTTQVKKGYLALSPRRSCLVVITSQKSSVYIYQLYPSWPPGMTLETNHKLHYDSLEHLNKTYKYSRVDNFNSPRHHQLLLTTIIKQSTFVVLVRAGEDLPSIMPCSSVLSGTSCLQRMITVPVGSRPRRPARPAICMYSPETEIT